jgi:hypothetical protein
MITTFIILYVSIGCLAVIWLLAKLDLYFTFIKESHSKVVLRGSLLHKIIGKGHGQGVLAKHLGIYFYGFWPIHRIYHPLLRWTDSSGQSHNRRVSNILMAKFGYQFTLMGLEIANQPVPFILKFLVTGRITDPALALFAIGDGQQTTFLDQLERLLLAGVREWVAGIKTYEDLQNLTPENKKALNDVLGWVKKEMVKFGWELDISQTEITEVAPGNEEVQRLTQQIYEAKLQREKTLIEASARMRARRMDGLGEAARMKAMAAQINASPEAAHLVAALQIAQDTKPADKMIILPGNLVDAFGGLLRRSQTP